MIHWPSGAPNHKYGGLMRFMLVPVALLLVGLLSLPSKPVRNAEQQVSSRLLLDEQEKRQNFHNVEQQYSSQQGKPKIQNVYTTSSQRSKHTITPSHAENLADQESNSELNKSASLLAPLYKPRTRARTSINDTMSSNNKILLVVNRWADHIGWLTDNSTGPALADLMDIVLYQPANIDSEGYPAFPGYDPATAEVLPTWPEWAEDYVSEKMETINIAEPGTVHDAKRLAQKLAAEEAELRQSRAQMYQTNTSSIGVGDVLDDDEYDDEEGLFPQEKSGTTKQGLVTIDAERSNRGAAAAGRGRKWKHQPPNAAAERLAGEGRNRRSADIGLLGGGDDGATDNAFSALLMPTWLQAWLRGTDDASSSGVKNTKGIQRKAVTLGIKPSTTVLLPEISPRLPVHIVPNRGGESSGYISAIIDNYESLPELVVFVHGHQASWHTFALGQEAALRMIAASPPRNLSGGMMQLACSEHVNGANQFWPHFIDANWDSPNGPRWHESMTAHYIQAWNEILGDALNMTLPAHIKAGCCATFAVTREAIHRRPKEFYIKIRDWLLTSSMERFWQGVVLEFTWHIMFTDSPVYDPGRVQCLCEMYDLCFGYA